MYDVDEYYGLGQSVFGTESPAVLDPDAPPKGRRVTPPANAVFCIHPVRRYGTWSFTDEEAGLQGEPFVGDINIMIDGLVQANGIKDAARGFNLYFGSEPIKGHQMSFTLIEVDAGRGGATYHCDQLKIQGWLCPALFCYFVTPPKKIYVRAEARR